MKKNKNEIKIKEKIYSDTIEFIDTLYECGQNIHHPEAYAHYFYDFIIRYSADMKDDFLNHTSTCDHAHVKSKKKKKKVKK